MAGGECPSEPAELAARLVKDGVLTEYQAKQILKGKSQGLIFGSYVILEFLGKGTMGKVYKASHRMMGRVVALKILDSRYISNARSLARFQREMQLVGRLDHPNVVRAFDADRVGDCHFIAMEYAAGLNPRGSAEGPRCSPTRRRGLLLLPRPPKGWPTPTRGASCTATSSLRTSW